MEINSSIQYQNTTGQHGYGLYVRFFQKELLLSPSELSDAQSVEVVAVNFILDTIESEWGFSVQHYSSVDYLSEPSEELFKFVTIKVSTAHGKVNEEMATLEAKIGYTHATDNQMVYRNNNYSTTPFDPNAIQIEYRALGMDQPQTDFGFKHFYSGTNLFGSGRGTYTIKLQFPEGYFDPQETLDQPLTSESFDSIQQINFRWSPPPKSPAQNKKKAKKGLANLMGTLYKDPATRMYIYEALKSGFPSTRRLGVPIEGGAFPHLFRVNIEELFMNPKDRDTKATPAKVNYKDVEQFRTSIGEEKELFWAEIQQNGEPITVRFPHFTTEALESLLNLSLLSYDESDSLQAVIFERDGEKVRCYIKLKVWAP